MATLALAGRRLENGVNTQELLGGLCCRKEDLLLDLEGLGDAKLAHVSNFALLHVQAHGVLALGVQRPQLRDKLGAVKAGIVGNNGGQLGPKKKREGV